MENGDTLHEISRFEEVCRSYFLKKKKIFFFF